MKKNTIYLRRKNKVIVKASKEKVSLEHLATLLKNIESLGYTKKSSLLLKTCCPKPTTKISFQILQHQSS